MAENIADKYDATGKSSGLMAKVDKTKKADKVEGQPWYANFVGMWYNSDDTSGEEASSVAPIQMEPHESMLARIQTSRKPAYAPEDDNLEGRLAGQLGFASTNTNDTSSAVADALIGNSVAVLPKADAAPALKIDNSNARTSGTGLMASTKGFETKEGAVSFIRDFVDLMGDLESTEDHVDSAGTTTLAYGILPTTAAGLGIDPTDYPDRKSFARAVYSKMYDEAKVKQAATFNAIPKDKHGSVMALYANVGEAGYNKLETVKGHLENNNLPSAGTALTQIVLYSQRDDDGKKVLDANGQPIMFASKGLSARRAKEYNILMAKEPGFKKVRTVTVSIKDNKPTFKWLDADRNVVKSYTAPAPLSADNDTTDQPI
jgi:hypothetical protein